MGSPRAPLQDGVREIVSVPARRPIKPVSIRQFPALVDAWRGWKTMRARFNQELDEYPFTVRPLSADEGGGYLVEYPD